MREQDRRLLERFRDRVKGRSTRGVRITLRVSGGLPKERLDQVVVLDGNVARIEHYDARHGARRQIREEAVDEPVRSSLLEGLSDRLDRLIPPRDAAFVPDALVGTAVVDVDGERVELLFSPDQALLPQFDEVSATPLADLAMRMLLAVQPAPVDEEA